MGTNWTTGRDRGPEGVLPQGSRHERGVFDLETGAVRYLDGRAPDVDVPDIEVADMHLDAGEKTTSVVVDAELLSARLGENRSRRVKFRCLDDGRAYSTIGAETAGATVPGSICITPVCARPGVLHVGRSGDQIRVVARPRQEQRAAPAAGHCDWEIRAYVQKNGQWREAPVQVIPVREELYSRTRGLFETDALAGRTVLILGQGSGGAPVSLGYAQLGINQILVDHDRLEVGNVARHVLGLSDVGRYKTMAMADRCRDKNPHAAVETHEVKIEWETEDLARALVRRSDLTVCAIDEEDGRDVINKVCVEEGTPLIVAGVGRRAVDGQILVVQPRRTPCYACYKHARARPDRQRDIAVAEHGERVAYSDRPVAIEPGLANDIAPVSTMIVKLSIQLFLRGKPTTLRSLDEDLVASWYLWINRREAETDYEHLEPLEYKVGGVHILRWYGIALDRNPACPVCGDFVGNLVETEGISLAPKDMDEFAAGGAAS